MPVYDYLTWRVIRAMSLEEMDRRIGLSRRVAPYLDRCQLTLTPYWRKTLAQALEIPDFLLADYDRWLPSLSVWDVLDRARSTALPFRELLRKRGLALEQAARLTGLSSQTLLTLGQGRMVALETYRAIYRALGIQPLAIREYVDQAPQRFHLLPRWDPASPAQPLLVWRMRLAASFDQLAAATGYTRSSLIWVECQSHEGDAHRARLAPALSTLAGRTITPDMIAPLGWAPSVSEIAAQIIAVDQITPLPLREWIARRGMTEADVWLRGYISRRLLDQIYRTGYIRRLRTVRMIAEQLQIQPLELAEYVRSIPYLFPFVRGFPDQ